MDQTQLDRNEPTDAQRRRAFGQMAVARAEAWERLYESRINELMAKINSTEPTAHNPKEAK